MSHAVLIAGHGSRDASGVAEFLGMARAFRDRHPRTPLAVGFLEFARPTIAEGVDQLAAGGAKTVVVLPGVLMAAGHAKNDMAAEVRQARERHPDVEIVMGRALDVDARLLQLCRLRYQEALAGRPEVGPGETMLLVVGRGSSDPDANANVAKVARFLQEGYPAAWAGVAFSGVARPGVPEGLAVAARSGFRRVVVQPYFLFTGVLLNRVYELTAAAAAAQPGVEFVPVPHLQTHDLLLDAFAERAREALEGTGHMNCSLCQYRVAIIGAEESLGVPQMPHHHHVRGLHAGHVHALGPPDDPPEPHPWSAALRERLAF